MAQVLCRHFILNIACTKHTIISYIALSKWLSNFFQYILHHDPQYTHHIHTAYSEINFSYSTENTLLYSILFYFFNVLSRHLFDIKLKHFLNVLISVCHLKELDDLYYRLELWEKTITLSLLQFLQAKLTTQFAVKY